MPSTYMTNNERSVFKRIIEQLDRTRSEKTMLRIVMQAKEFLDKHDIDWSAVHLYIPANYVFVSQRRKWRPTTMTPQAATKVVTAVHPQANGTAELGRDGKALLKKALVNHPDWPVVRDTLAVDISHTTVADCIALAQLLKLDDRFISMFIEKEAPVQKKEVSLNDFFEDEDEDEDVTHPSN